MEKYIRLGDLYIMKSDFMKKAIAAAMIAVCAFSFAACSNAGGEEASVSGVSSVATVKATATPKSYTFPKGSTYGELDISGLTLNDAISQAENYCKEQLKKITVTVTFNNQSLAISGDSAEIDTNNAKTELTKVSKTSEKAAVACEYTVKTNDTTKKKLEEFRDSTEIKMENATITSFNSQTEKFKFKEGSSGEKIDVDKTLTLVGDQFNKKANGTVKAETIKTDPEVTVDMLNEKYGLISSYYTISTNTENGNHNMALAAEKINGTVLQPGEQFSFNDVVGDSTTAESGFLPANGIVGGVLTPVYGGGICQTSSTLYLACLYAGLQIDFRDCHQMPSSYVPIGLDATVSYPDLDYKFTNNMDTTIYICAGMEDTTLTVKIYGVQPDSWDNITVDSWTEETLYPDDGVVYETDYSLAQNQVELKASYMLGYKAEASRTFYKNGEALYTEQLGESVYSPRQTTYKVGPNTDTSQIVDGVYVGSDAYSYSDDTTDSYTDSTENSDSYVDSGSDAEIPADDTTYDDTTYYDDTGSDGY